MPEEIVRLRASLADIEPEIWRVIEAPADISLRTLHDVVQAAMGWQDCHLWEFEAGDTRYGLPDPGWDDEDVTPAVDVTLGDLIAKDIDGFAYTYDMGDDWLHSMRVESVRPAEPGVEYPRYIEGARRAPPEDVGGWPGFEVFRDAMANPRHPEHKELMDWHGGPFDAEAIDADAIRTRLARIATEIRDAR